MAWSKSPVAFVSGDFLYKNICRFNRETVLQQLKKERYSLWNNDLKTRTTLRIMVAKSQAQLFQEFCMKHSVNFLEMALRRDRCRRIDDSCGRGKKTGQCGDTVEFFVDLKGGRLRQVCYQCEGCLNTHACCNTVAEMVEGKSEKQAWEITPEDISEFLETLPDDHFHCAELAVGAYYLALKHAGNRGI